MERDSTEYKLAEKIVQLEKALRVANRALELSGSYGVHPDISVSFRESQKFHKRVREVIKENK
jgi:hypothetical protein